MAEAKGASHARKTWFVTCYCPTEDCRSHFKEEAKCKMDSYVFQVEICPNTGREHKQAGFILSTKKRFKQAKEIWGCPQAHLEPAKGTPAEIKAYCTKEETRKPGTTPTIFNWPDDLKGKGKRSDLAAAAAAVKEGKTDSEVSA